MIKPISKKKYYVTISEQIQQAILAGEWAEGSRVPTEDELASIFDVGRGSIREAITNLQMSGILVSSPGIGTYVSDNAIACIYNSQLAEMLNNPECSQDMVAARRILEPEMAAHAALKATQEDIDRMQAAIDKLKSEEGRNDWIHFGHQFHLALCETSRNRILNSFFIALEEPTRKMHPAASYTDEVKTKLIGEYEGILDAIVRKDPLLAAQLMRDHLK